MKDSILLITGGTGSFGSAVLNRFSRLNLFKEIRILSRDEKKQHDLRMQYLDSNIKFYIGDVRDYSSILSSISGADYIFHAAALKQVPSCEFFPLEAVKTNIIGTDNVLTAAEQCGVKKVVVLSTDKAAYPVNAMGMSKAIMEKVMIAKSRNLDESKTIFCATRYGNVMASRGSVIPLFLEQIKSGLPLTVTDLRMTRFMMTLEDAVDLVLFAFGNARQGDLFVQKAPAASLNTLSKALIQLYDSRSDVKVIGIRHGEKLYETLVNREDMQNAIDLGNYYRIPADTRDLNYEKYFTLGNENNLYLEEYHSNNTTQLTVEGMKDLLLKLPLISKDFS